MSSWRCNCPMLLRCNAQVRPPKHVEEILKKTPGVDHVTSVIGYNMISGVQNTYSAFFWVTLKEWSERKAPEEQYAAIKAHINGELQADSRQALPSRFHLRPSPASALPVASPSYWKTAAGTTSSFWPTM